MTEPFCKCRDCLCPRPQRRTTPYCTECKAGKHPGLRPLDIRYVALKDPT